MIFLNADLQRTVKTNQKRFRVLNPSSITLKKIVYYENLGQKYDNDFFFLLICTLNPPPPLLNPGYAIGVSCLKFAQGPENHNPGYCSR